MEAECARETRIRNMSAQKNKKTALWTTVGICHFVSRRADESIAMCRRRNPGTLKHFQGLRKFFFKPIFKEQFNNLNILSNLKFPICQSWKRFFRTMNRHLKYHWFQFSPVPIHYLLLQTLAVLLAEKQIHRFI